MNWTGGKLKRHVRSHGKQELGAQRNYFARTSRLRKEDTQFLPAFGAILPSSAEDFQSPEAHLRDQQNFHTDSIALPQQYPVGLEQSTRNALSDDGIECKPTQVLPNSFDDMKKRLLAQPDWLGLSTHYPAKIDFPSMNNVAKIGRHRKINLLTRSATSKRPSNCDKQKQHCVKTTIGKRKRSDQEGETAYNDDEKSRVRSREHPQTQASLPVPQALWNIDRRQLESVSEARTSLSHVSMPPKDDNRRHYRLSDHSPYPEDCPDHLVSLEEVKMLKNFDAVKQLHLELSKPEYMTRNKTLCETADMSCQAASLESALLDQSTNESTDFSAQHSISKNPGNLDDRAYKRVTALSYQKTSGCTELPFRPTEQNNNQYQLVGSKDLSRDLCGSWVEVKSIATDREPGIAIRDFASTNLTVSGSQKTRNNASKPTDHTVRQFALRSPALEVQEVPPIFKTNTSVCEKPHEISGQVYSSEGNTTILRPQGCFKLDTDSEPNDCDDLGLENTTHLVKQRNEPKNYAPFELVSSPHFTHIKKREERTSLTETFGDIPQCSIGHRFSNNIEHTQVGQQHGHQKPSSLPLQLKGGSACFDQRQQPGQEREEFLPFDSSSPTLQIQRNVPATIFSTPPKPCDSFHAVSTCREFSPYFERTDLR